MSLSNQTFILKNDGTLWGCGNNYYGQLGLGDTNKRTTFTQIISDVKSVYCGGDYTVILKNNGTLWGCGHNTNYPFGLGQQDMDNKLIFTQITINTDNVKSVYCGSDYTLILKNDGTLWGCGNNTYGQLGLEDTGVKPIFTMIGSNPGDIKSICCGNNYTLILQNNGTLWGCGYNGNGELGLGDTTSRNIFIKILDDIKSVYCSNGHTIILKNDGTLWGSGYNAYGQLGLGDTNKRTIFTKITDNIKSVCCGNYYTIILKNDGTLWGCGANVFGQLGLGDTNNRNTFTQVTENADNIKSFANYYPDLPSVIKIYDMQVGYAETLDTNNFRNISTNNFEKIKVLYTKPLNTYANCLISFDKKQTLKTFNGTTWTTISDISPSNIILNCMDIETLNTLTKQDLIKAGFTGNLDFKVAIKTNNEKVTPSITKIYMIYKNPF